MKNCFKKLKELIENVVLPDVEDYLDDIFEQIASAKNASDENTRELENIQEMRSEFKDILEEIKNKELSQEECNELYTEIEQMVKENIEE